MFFFHCRLLLQLLARSKSAAHPCAGLGAKMSITCQNKQHMAKDKLWQQTVWLIRPTEAQLGKMVLASI